MSRSYKKHGILKYGTNISKAKANRKFRHRNRQRIEQGLDPFQMYELVNPWEVNDVWSMWKGESYYRTLRGWRRDRELNKWFRDKPLYSEQEIIELKRHYFKK